MTELSLTASNNKKILMAVMFLVLMSKTTSVVNAMMKSEELHIINTCCEVQRWRSNDLGLFFCI